MIALCLLLAAEVERFALIAGNDTGLSDEPSLRFAETDAEKMASVLTELGGFPPENVVTLRGRDAPEMRRALIALNDRIRARVGAAEPLLLVYYSGHADAKALHLGESSFELGELEALVRGSAAGFRLLVLDACRSGALTRVKGGALVPPFPIQVKENLEGEGVVFLTSSAASEDAQESDALKGSFFTHFFVSALRGAGDQNGDGRVSLGEAYGHAYEQTLRASSRTLAGTQHPTFRYELAGRGDVVLSELSSARSHGQLILPEGMGYLVFAKGADGPVVAELSAEGPRALSIPAGRYWVLSRGRDHVLEGPVEVTAGGRREVRVEELDRVAYARLVRKGGGEVFVQGTQAALFARSALFAGEDPCFGASVAHGLDFEILSVRFGASACRSGFANPALSAESIEIDLEAGVLRAFDLAPVTLALGGGLGGGLFHQRFEATGLAPERTAFAPYAFVEGEVEVELGSGFFGAGRVGGAVYVPYAEGLDAEAWSPRVVVRGGAGLRKRW